MEQPKILSSQTLPETKLLPGHLDTILIRLPPRILEAAFAVPVASRPRNAPRAVLSGIGNIGSSVLADWPRRTQPPSPLGAPAQNGGETCAAPPGEAMARTLLVKIVPISLGESFL
jgi:hypothetical protein